MRFTDKILSKEKDREQLSAVHDDITHKLNTVNEHNN